MAELKYGAGFPQQAREYAERGMNNAEIARYLGISQDSFYVYLRRFPEFAEAVETGRQVIADNAGVSLMDLAAGRVYITTSRRDAGGGEIRTIRQKAPDVKAIIKWLERNRQYADDGWADDSAAVQDTEIAVMPVPANMRYKQSFPEEVEFHAANGDTDDRISRRMNISPATFYNYKRQFPAFAAALARGRSECYGRLRRCLLSLALGECGITTETVRGGVTRRAVKRMLPPNLTAIKYWLAQRDSKVTEPEESEKSGKRDCPDYGSRECGREKRRAEKATALPQASSKVTESAGNTGKYGKTGKTGKPGIGGGVPAAETATTKPQASSKVSEPAVDTCFPRPPSLPRLPSRCPAEPASKISESFPDSGKYEKYGIYGIGGGLPAAGNLRYAGMSRQERRRMMRRHFV